MRELIGSLRLPRAAAAGKSERGPREGMDAANALGGTR